jgi:hypothetical protein
MHLFRKVDEAANFVFVQLTEQEPRIWEKRHPDYARQGKIDLACENISHETESGSRLSSFGTIYKRFSLNCHRRTDAPNVFFS